jgi:hypothetical protein
MQNVSKKTTKKEKTTKTINYKKSHEKNAKLK